MGRDRQNPVRKFFIYDGRSDTSRCRIGDCNVVMKGTHAANLERHVRRHHPDEHATLCQEKRDLVRATHDEPPCKRPTRLGSLLNASNAKLSVHEDNLLDACVELVTVNGRPFELLNDSGFQRILNPLMCNTGNNSVINIETVQQKIVDIARMTREAMREEIQNKLVSLKIDCATSGGCSVLGINLLYITDGKVIVYTLAVRDISDHHNSNHLKMMILDVLKEYEISTKQLYSIILGNSANMVKLKTTNNDDCLEPSVVAKTKNHNWLEPSAVIKQENHGWQEPSVVIKQEHLENNDERSFDEECDDCMLSNRKFEMLQEAAHFDNVDAADDDIRGVACGTHFLQMAIDETMKDESFKCVLNNARTVCKKLKTPAITVILKNLNLKPPILDCPAKWHSTYEMLERLSELQDFCEALAASKNEEHYLSSEDWKGVKNVIESLVPSKVAMVTMQVEQCSFGDFYGAWLKCQLDTEKLSCSFAKALSVALKRYEKMLLANDAFKACIYLDPRYNVLLSEDNKLSARNHLMNVWVKLQALKSDNESYKCSDNKAELYQSDECDDELDAFIKACDSIRKHERQRCHVQQRKIGHLLDCFLDEPHLGRNNNIFTFWETKKLELPELYELSKVALSVPATRVGVERAFSVLEFLSSHQRSNLDDWILNDMIFVRVIKLFSPH